MDGAKAAALPKKQEVFRRDYQPPAFFVDEINLHFDVLSEEEVLVTARSKVRRASSTPSGQELTLDGSIHFQLVSVSVDGQALSPDDYKKTGGSLSLASAPDQFTLEITTRLNPVKNTRLEGLYASGGNLCTQCEAEGFRHVTYALDRPDVLSVYTVRIEAAQDQFPILLSNGNPVSAGELGAERHYAEWHDPHPKPAYLFALVAGNLAALSDSFMTKSGRKVALNIYVREPDLGLCQHAMDSLKRAMKWDEDVYGLEYDLDVYNIVAVSDFNMGAMENKGLNVFNTKYVLADEATATDTDFENVEGVIAHEYFHNWTGNRVTCRDWFQLSLKEGLTVFRDQEFSADMASRGVKRINDVRVLRLAQFPEDAGPLAHPIRPDSFVEINNFYTATVYNKGAEVIRMMQTLLGSRTFIEGVRHYLEKHDGTAATCEDFVAAMEEVSGRSLLQFRRWYEQAGTPVVSVTQHRKGNDIVLEFEQVTQPTPGQADKQAFHMPISFQWFDQVGRPIAPTSGDVAKSSDQVSIIELTKNQQVMRFVDVPEGAVLSLHRQFSAPIRLQTKQKQAEKAFIIKHETDAYARWQAAQEIYTSFILSEYGSAEDTDAMSKGALFDLYRELLTDDDGDLSLKAELLTLPSEQYLGQLIKPLNPQRLHDIRTELLKDMVQDCGPLMVDVFGALCKPSLERGQQGSTARKLKNIILGYLSVADHPTARELSLTQYKTSNNMTDQLAALTAVSHSNWGERADVLDSFYEQWKADALVIDKWFSVQALSIRPSTLEDVKTLSKHEDFSFSNPNRLRSLILTFASGNPAAFHEKNGRAYQYLRECIATVDALNPQTAARMVAPLARWKDMAAPFNDLIQTELKATIGTENVSDDVRELVEKALS